MSKGDVVTVVRGQKVPHGTTGTVIWTGDRGYGERLGIKDADGNVHWTAASNVRVRDLNGPIETTLPPPFGTAPTIQPGVVIEETDLAERVTKLEQAVVALTALLQDRK